MLILKNFGGILFKFSKFVFFFKEAIKKYYATTDRVAVFFERNFKTSHCQLQAVPVHKNQAPSLKEAFQVILHRYPMF